MNPRHPVYIVSKGRWESRLTSRALEAIGVPYRIVIEPQEAEPYSAVIDPEKLLLLPQRFHDEYDPCTDEDPEMPNGSGAGRNFAWEHAISEGAESHWLLDDNIGGFGRFNKNLYGRSSSGTIFRAAEDFVARYENVPLSGFQYFMFALFRRKSAPFLLNTRIYSCLLIRNDASYRWRGRYNEDTDLSLRVLKDGYCTILFKAFLQEKAPTLSMKGGNTDTIYVDGTRKKSEMIRDLHPDVASVVWKYGRWHHHVDYRPFKHNKLIRRTDVDVADGIDNYGMIVRRE